MSVSERQVVFVAVGMVHELEAHRRHADEIGDSLLLDQPQRLARVPFGHQHHAAADDEAVEHHRHFAGDVEQGHAEQGPRLVGRRAALLGQDAEQDDEPGRIGIDAGGDRAVGRKRALGLAGRARGEQDRRVVFGRDLGQDAVLVAVVRGARPAPARPARRSAGSESSRSAQRAAIRFARGASAMISLGSVRSSACSISCASHQPLSRVAIAPALSDRHVGDDPGRAVAHRDADAVALADPARGQPVGDAFGNAVELGEGQPLVARDHGFGLRVQCSRRCGTAPAGWPGNW